MPPRGVNGSKTGATLALVVLIAAITLQDADARVKVVGAIPEDYWGAWTTGKEPCKSGDTEILVLSAKAYTGPLGKCDVVSVSEIPGENGAIFSARLQCTDSNQTKNKTSANLIMRLGETGQIAVGPTFESLKTYQRCPKKAPASN